MGERHPSRNEFLSFAREVEPRLRIALVAAHGPQRGLEAAADALAFAWEHWDRVAGTRNPAGYLYRVAQRRVWRTRRDVPLMREVPVQDSHWVEPGLDGALDHLSRMQRTVVVLIDGFDWTHQEVAELLGVQRSTVQKHRERGLARLRRDLGVVVDV